MARCTGASCQRFSCPMVCARSFGPTKTASTPLTAAMAAALATPKGVSIMTTSANDSLLRWVWATPPNAP